MCGITGLIDFTHSTKEDEIEGMTKTLHHRGPDSFGFENYYFKEAFIGFGQTRLAIIDITSGGHQPMHFEYLSIVFNGEIYNFKEIKEELNKVGHIFLSTSDTEVILHAYYEWGEKAVDKFIGMFVFTILDRKEMKVKIFRDRAGVKPLYYYYKNGLFLFGSELKSLMKNYKFERIINKSIVPTYLQYGYIPAPHTIFENCYKILPGNIINIDLENQSVSAYQYWDVKEFYFKPKLDISFNEAKAMIHDLLISACNYRMVSDVPVGVFLSGGYDSTAITSILQSQRSDKLKTFTIGLFDGNNEAIDAKRQLNFWELTIMSCIAPSRTLKV
ncbi:MAG: asparagine synthase (glutamine-hydrolyzing) [Saprospiraceae bacterium]|nr:asparagine synthase (glutamine-hydrolyzing) [Saprospiraceae bacterium]